MRNCENMTNKEMEVEMNNLDVGSVVYIDPMYDWSEKKDGKKFFVSVLSGGCVLLADKKKQAVNDHSGYIYNFGSVSKF